jgi:glycosyltransferase involved in cell wall biosynthesis
VEGWRGINHSYALVNQYQLLYLSRIGNITLRRRDLPYYRPEWVTSGCGFDAASREIIDSIPEPQSPDQEFDCIYRISFPFRVHAGNARRILVFGTTEFKAVPKDWFCPEQDASSIAKLAARGIEIVTPSNWSKAGFVRSGFPPEHVHVIPLGVEVGPERYGHPGVAEKQQLRFALGLPSDAFVFLNIGAMTWNKGVAPLLIAFAIHKKKYPASLLILKGADFLYGNTIKKTIDEARALRPGALDDGTLGSIIYNRHNLSNDDMAKLYRACDAYVSPYRAEGFNLPVLEAVASGLPVLVTAGGPTDDFCRDDFCLRIGSVPTVAKDLSEYLEPDIDHLVELMARVVDDTSMRAVASKAGPAWVAKNYSWSGIAVRVAELMQR